MQAITERLRCRWQRAAEAGDTVQMTEDLVCYTVDVTTALSFGEDPNTIDQPGDLIQDHLARIFYQLAHQRAVAVVALHEATEGPAL
jgi:hypothetical protein